MKSRYVRLEPIKYHHRIYPYNIIPTIHEVATHFDVKKIKKPISSSLHTEYSYYKRKFISPHLYDLDVLCLCSKHGIPMLWYSEKWALQFAIYLKRIIKTSNLVKIIEIHPPFTDYCKEFNDFLKIYKMFEEDILNDFPDVEIVIENRYGTMYRGGSFLLSKCSHFNELSELIYKHNLKLRIALDIMQVFSAHSVRSDLLERMDLVFSELAGAFDFVRSIHLWGKRKGSKNNWISHRGDLNSYFEGNLEVKKVFLSKLYDICNDDQARYFVPEVNSSNNDLKAIIDDLIDFDFRFN